MSTSTSATADGEQDSQVTYIPDGTAPQGDETVTLEMADATVLELTNVLAADARRHADEGRHATAEHLRRLRASLKAARP